jgi:hypothetical protein
MTSRKFSSALRITSTGASRLSRGKAAEVIRNELRPRISRAAVKPEEA